MPNLQSTYSQFHARWVEGMVLNMEPADIITLTAEDVEGIGFGKVGVKGSTDDFVVDSEITVPFVGIAIIDQNVYDGKYQQYDNVALMRKGVVVVQASVAVAKGDPVYYVPATGVLTNVATSNTLIAGAIWETSTTGAGLAALRLNTP